MGQINKKFDAMEFLEKLYEIDKQIIEEYERLQDEVKEGLILEKLNLNKLRLLISEENKLISSINTSLEEEINDLILMIDMAKEYVNNKEESSFNESELFDFNHANPNNEEIINRMWRIIYGINNIIFGDYITLGLNFNSKNSKKIKLDRAELGTIISFLEQYLLSKEQVWNLKINHGLDDGLIKKLYIKLDAYFLGVSSGLRYLALFTINNKDHIIADEEIKKTINLIKHEYLSQKTKEMYESATMKTIEFIKALSNMKLDLCNINSIFKYISLWSFLEILIKDCDLDSLEVVTTFFNELEYFEDERIRDSILELLKTKKNKLK